MNRSVAGDLREMARIAAPIVLTNVGIQTMGVVDTIMVGRLGGSAIAAVALGNFYFFNVIVFALGLLFVIDPVVAQAVGAGDDEGVAMGVQRGLVLALIVAIPVTLSMLPGEWLLRLLHQPAEVVDITAQYSRRRALAVLPFLAFNVLRQTLQAIGTVRAVVFAVIIANLGNVLANWVLIYGHLGFRPGGVAGAGLATAISQWFMLLTLLILAWPVLRTSLRPWRQHVIQRAAILRMLGLGMPIGTQWFLEGFAFGLTTLFMGWMGTISLAGHEIALNMASLTFMVPQGISGAAAAVVGRAIGRGDIPAARRDATAAIACGIGFMCLTAAVFIAAPLQLARGYTSDPATLAIAVSLIPLAGVFQVFDGSQAVTGGVLRATGDTRIPAIMHMVAFWGIGIPLGAYLGFYTSLRERGLWWGLVAGLAAAAILQLWRVRVRMARHIERVFIG